jgi:DNA-directed RNA polymerase subunit omega
MARITVEDCLTKETNRFALVLLASKRTKQILHGGKTLTDSKNKAVVTALREIAAGKVRFMTDDERMAAEEERRLEEEQARQKAIEAQAKAAQALANAAPPSAASVFVNDDEEGEEEEEEGESKNGAGAPPADAS